MSFPCRTGSDPAEFWNSHAGGKWHNCDTSKRARDSYANVDVVAIGRWNLLDRPRISVEYVF